MRTLTAREADPTADFQFAAQVTFSQRYIQKKPNNNGTSLRANLSVPTSRPEFNDAYMEKAGLTDPQTVPQFVLTASNRRYRMDGPSNA